MARLVRFASPSVAEVVEVDDPVAGPGEVVLETLYSGISAGTELTAYRGTNPYLDKTWDPTRRLFVPGASTHEYPLDGWGYEEVGRVVSAHDEEDQDLVGATVWGAWGHRSHAVRPTAYVRPRVLPGGTTPRVGVFAKIAAIAMNAVHDADIHVGETVVVFGAGVPGQIASQLARLNGATVVAVDPVVGRRGLAETLGAHASLDPLTDDVAEIVRSMTADRGADVVIEMSGSQHALREAIRTAAYSSRVVAAGFFQGDGSALRLGEELHHNRISVVTSQISGVAPHLQHRWDELRMSTTCLALERDGALRLGDLISHVVPDREAPAMFEMLDRSPADGLQVVLDYGVEA